MANTLTNLLPTIYDALDIVARELVGFIPAVTRNSTAERVTLNQNVTFPIAPAVTLSDITPGQLPPDDGDQTIGTSTLTITKSKYAPVRWSGEEQLGVSNTYPTNVQPTIMRDQFAQAMRALCNAVEADLFTAVNTGASRAFGSNGQTLPTTAPFATASDLSDSAGVRRILDDNGTTQTDLHLVLGSAAMQNIRGKQAVLFRVNEAGTAELLRQGTIGMLEGFAIHNSAAVVQVAAGTGAAYVTSGSSAAGTNTVVLATGSGTVLPGDIVKFAADTNNLYVVTAGISAPGTITLGTPGLKVTIPTGNAMTIIAAHTPNFAFNRAAVQLVTRAPAMPVGPDGRPMDAADDVIEVVDPISGLAFQVAAYRLYRRIKYEVGLAWGVKTIKNDFVATLIGA
jgi:hypothetical protein